MAGVNWLMNNPDYGLVDDDMVLPAKPGGISDGLSDAVKGMYTPMPMRVSGEPADWDPSIETAIPVSTMGAVYGGAVSSGVGPPSVVPSVPVVRDASVVPAGGETVDKASWSDFSSFDSFGMNAQTMQGGAECVIYVSGVK